MRKLASIQKVLDVQPIPGAEAIEVLTILGWKVVAKKGEFKVGDLVVYCEVDSILPAKPEFAFLEKVHYRIKTIKLRGQVSQGIAFPLHILPIPPQIHPAIPNPSIISDCSLRLDYREGDDVTELLGVTKYEPYVPAQLAGLVKGNFPEFLHKTDETRIQAVPAVLYRHQNKKFYVTEKVDGSSMTVYFRRSPECWVGEFGVCSRNLDIKEEGGTSFWKVARELDLENKLRSLERNICLQGELIGQGIQGNKYKLSGLEFRVFNVFDIDKQQHVGYNEFVRIVNQLGLKTVPLLDDAFVLPGTVDEMVEYSKGKSVLNKDSHREGVVLRPIVEEYDEDLRGRLSFKCINPDFLLKYNE
jgi:RNA ligase (TIGR02306 family)